VAFLFKSDIDRGGDWERALKACDPGLDLRVWPEAGDPAGIDYALVWKPPPGELASYPNLKVIFSIGAGIDHLSSDPALPKHLPVVRMVEPGLTAGMSEFVVMSVLTHHRFMLDYAAQARAEVWDEIGQIGAARRGVGMMGLGVLGRDALDKLAPFGFRLAAWSRTKKQLPGVACFHGAAGMTPFLAASDILVCLLPLTDETRGILDRRTFAALPKGAAVINLARGGHLIEDDLLAALDGGQLSGATLDVFQEEPLPKGHPLWHHPRVVMTPHIASMTIPETAAQSVFDNIRRFEAGQPMTGLVDWGRGY